MNFPFEKLLLMIPLISINLVIAQPYQVKELQVGDQCPAFVFEKILNHSKGSATLNDYKGKLVILDFWATWCSPCVDALPKLEALQNKFAGKLAVLPVTSEPADKILAFKAFNKNMKDLHLPLIVANKQLKKFFPHNMVPHEVWIDGKGLVIAITSGEDVNEKSVNSYFAEGKLPLKQKKDIIGWDLRKPMLFDAFQKNPGPVQKDNLIYSSFLMGYISGLPFASTGPMVGDTSVIIKGVNATIATLYSTAFGSSYEANAVKADGNTYDFLLRLPPRLIWEAQDSSKYIGWAKDPLVINAIPPETWLYNYELVLPKHDSLKVNQYMVEDLNRYFGDKLGIVGTLEKRRVKCWVLKRTIDQDLLSTKGGSFSWIVDPDRKKLKATNVPFNTFMYRLGGQFERYQVPLVDETGYKQNIDLDLDVDPKDFDAINEALRKYGISFFLEERNLNMIVIKDKVNL